jgi:hypothetical protein
VRELGKFGSSGCRQRFHLPTEEDPAYKAAVEEKTAVLSTAMEEADKRLEVIVRDDVKDMARKVKLSQVKEIVETVEKERAVVKKAEMYKFSDTLLSTFKEQVRADQETKKEKGRTRAGIARMGADLAERK